MDIYKPFNTQQLSDLITFLHFLFGKESKKSKESEKNFPQERKGKEKIDLNKIQLFQLVLI